MKLNRLRNLALGLIFLAFLIMFVSLYFIRIYPVAISYAFGIGTLMIIVSVVIYFRLGAISMRIPKVECPSCGKMTKALGREDGCMYCKTPFRIIDGGHAVSIKEAR